ncbi:MAG: hypothetical protein OXC25_01535 [Thiotrichales bacterium]|nr:hypothetical protein [Thiotrichales bacterium]MCY4284501.1 hypothetical protein [Thiotrichales bacterium]MCY4348516.1 hypothetical protein [Thiotrichales bacterium]
MKTNGAMLRVELHSRESEDGRILINSPDLKGFYFVVSAGEDPMTAMKPTLMEFMQIYLKAEIRRIERAHTPRQFRRNALGIEHRPQDDFSVFAEVALA